MKRVHFYLRKGKKGEYSIYLCVREGKNRSYRKSLFLYVRPCDWDKKKMRLKLKAKNKEATTINKYLDSLETSLISLFIDNARHRQETSLQEVKSFVLKNLIPQPKQRNDVLIFLHSYIKQLDTTLNSVTHRPLAKSTKDKFVILYKLLKEYKNYFHRDLYFNDIDLDFYNSFVVFLQKNKGYANNTIGKYIGALKTILNEALIKGLSTNMIHKSRRFRTINEDSQAIYLTPLELDKIFAVNIPKKWEDSRNLFLIACYTGLRYSDLVRLNRGNIINESIQICQQKTGDLVIIPLCKKIIGLINRIDKLKKISNTKINKDIKQICKIADINDSVTIEKTKAGVLSCVTLHKWQLVSTHTARRTFVTNMYIKGIPINLIMKLTGHKSEKAFMKYLRISITENAKILATIWQDN